MKVYVLIGDNRHQKEQNVELPAAVASPHSIMQFSEEIAYAEKHPSYCRHFGCYEGETVSPDTRFVFFRTHVVGIPERYDSKYKSE